MVAKKSKSLREKRPEVGLAVGGLAGNNAYGAGVLQAALDCELRPEMISCTSGQIHWVHRFLQAKPAAEAKGGTPCTDVLRQHLQEDIWAMKPTGVEVIDMTLFGLRGKPNVLRPALPELPVNMMRNLQAAMNAIGKKAIDDWRTVFSCYRELVKIVPAQMLVPLFPNKFFEDIARDFNAENKIGIAFNSFDVKAEPGDGSTAGVEYVYLNERARALLDVQFEEPDHYRERTIYREITPDSVREGLWVYEYGRPESGSAVDGAYFRQVMLSELARCNTIYSVRPINSRWIGPFPTSWVGLQDLKTEVNFNGTYAGERDKVNLVNYLIDKKAFKKSFQDAKNYQKVDFCELEIPTQEGFLDYATESIDVFDAVYAVAENCFPKRRRQKKSTNRERAAALA